MRRSSVEINLYQMENMRIGKIARGAEYRMDKQLQNFSFFGILIIAKFEKL